jgi:ribosomal-protein-alanine N-acetyltransferase
MTDAPIGLVAITPSHGAVLAALHKESFTEHWDEDAFASALAQPGAFGFIVTQDNGAEPLGFALLRAVVFAGGGGEAEVLTLATRPGARRQGVARRALTAALAQAHAFGVERVYLEVAADNAAARALYTSLGFCEVGRRKGYYARSNAAAVDAVVMEHA